MQKTKYEGLYKQQEGILLNMDNEALQQYKLSKQKARKFSQIESDIQELKSEFREIKELLKALVK